MVCNKLIKGQISTAKRWARKLRFQVLAFCESESVCQSKFLCQSESLALTKGKRLKCQLYFSLHSEFYSYCLMPNFSFQFYSFTAYCFEISILNLWFINIRSDYETNLFQGLHPRLITEGFEVAKKKALEVSFLCGCCNCHVINGCFLILTKISLHLCDFNLRFLRK